MCLSSGTPTSSRATGTDPASLPSPNGGLSGAAGSGGSDDGSPIGAASGGVVDAAAAAVDGAGGGVQAVGTDAANAIIVEGDDPVIDEDEHRGKRVKRCTSDVWEHFTKKELVIEDNGKTYVQRWAYCKWPKCKHKGRCESNYGTTGFWTHLRVSHSVVKG